MNMAYVDDQLEKINKLQTMTGITIDTLIKLFEFGYTLEAPYKIEIQTGKELLDSGITKFEVFNGGWIGEVIIKNNRPHLYIMDHGGTLINSHSFTNATKLDLIIKPLKYGEIPIV